MPNEEDDDIEDVHMQGQCCFQNTGPKAESPWEVVTFQVFLGAVCKQARMKANFECQFAVSFTFIWRFTVKKSLCGCGKS